MTLADPPGLGHNQPPEADRLDAAALLERLRRDHEELLRRFVELEHGAGRVPSEILNEEQAQRAADFIAQCHTATGQADKAHKSEKAPYLACSRVVDRFFLDRVKRFAEDVIAPVNAASALYLEKKRQRQRQAEAAQRQRALEEQRRAEAEAQRLAAEAAAATNRQKAADLGRQAEEAQERAETAATIAEAPPAPVRIHGDYGTTAYAKERYLWEVVDPFKIPMKYLRTNDEVISQDINRGGVREIPGLRIWQENKFIVRKC